MESVEKSEIFQRLPQPSSDGGDERRRGINTVRDVEISAFQEKQEALEKGTRIGYNQAAAGKERQSKQGSTATCSGLTK